MIAVFYDGKCGLCRREITYYQRIAPVGRFQWIDITTTSEPFTALGYTVPEGLKALHVRDAKQNMHIGVDGFIVIWRALPRWRLLALIVAMPIIRPLARACYALFAKWRFHKLGYDACAI
jgi:predicted DCC family thiol-disulfide oxidoreductase YuxK